jgi:hypothetical protein
MPIRTPPAIRLRALNGAGDDVQGEAGTTMA